jgi:formate dehydrogenase major subunit
VPGLGTSFGRGGATTAPSDLVNSDAILIMGSNMAENHPVGFQWVIEARERGAKVIHVDPRFSRTSAVANVWAPLRAGSDILFLGGLIHYVLENEKDFREYVIHYTNASIILPEEFQDSEDLGGVFSGWDPQNRRYDGSSWLYGACVEGGRAAPRSGGPHSGHFKDGNGPPPTSGIASATPRSAIHDVYTKF